MTAISITPGYPTFADTDGSPLNDGYVYIGLENQDPITAPTGAFWDKAFQVPADQPLRTSGGYIVRNGTPAAVYTGASYSILVQNKNLVTVYNAPSAVITNVTNNVEEITQYQGAHATDPIARNDGTPLEVGDLYFNTVINELKVWTGSAWVPASPGAITVQNFTGTGAQTGFNLASAPVSENNTQIYIDGVYQQKDTYTVAGATINFSTAPPYLSGIEVVTFSIAALGTVDASNVSYNEGSAGAVNTSVQTKLQESVSVKDFGAVGDGVADDTAAFAAALVMGKAVYAPAGTYKATFTIPYGGILYGDGPAHTIITPTAGSTHAIMLDGTIVGGTQFCTVENLSIRNPNAVASCSGLKLYGLDVFDVNDNHTFSNLYISGFNYGIEILGRCIVSTFKDITTDASNTGLYVASDAANYAFNANTFTNCRFINGQAYGVYITGYAGLGLTFTGCDFEQNNLNNVVGGAGIEIENAETVTFQGCYWEANGAGIPVDAIFPANNGVDLILSGLRSYENHIDGSWFAASTTSILVTSTAAIYGGSVAGNRFQNRAGGWSVAVTGRYPDNNQPVFEINANNIFGGKIQITENGDEKNPAYLGQSDSCIFSAAATSLDLVTHKNVVFSDASPFTISTLENAYPGMELWIYNAGTGEITIAAGLAHDAAAISITAGESFSFVVSTFPLRGKLIPKTIRKEGTWTPLQGSGLTLVGAYGSAGTYIRDGSKVTIIGQISGATSVAIGGSGQMCTGLPFAAGSFGVGSTINNTLSASGACQASGSTLIASTFGASAVIYFSCTYFV
jgi:hypothetical protein